MSGFVTLDIDTAGFDLVIKGLSGSAKVPMKTATLAESKSVLQGALDRTKMAARKVIEQRTVRRYNTYAAGDVGSVARSQMPRISIAPQARNNWWIERNDEGVRTFYIMNGQRRWSDERWQAYVAEEADRQADFKEAVTEALARRGLPKQSWYMLAELLGMQLKAGKVVVEAKVNKNRLRHVARTIVEDLDSAFVVHFTNSSRSTYYADGGRILSMVMRNRVKFFEKNLKLGVFESMEKIAKAYPNLLTVNRT